jgi:hypothetical protein
LTEQVNPIGLQGIQLALPDSIVPFKPFAAQRAFPSFIFRHPGYLAAEEEVTGLMAFEGHSRLQILSQNI